MLKYETEKLAFLNTIRLMHKVISFLNFIFTDTISLNLWYYTDRSFSSFIGWEQWSFRTYIFSIHVFVWIQWWSKSIYVVNWENNIEKSTTWKFISHFRDNSFNFFHVWKGYPIWTKTIKMSCSMTPTISSRIGMHYK